MLFYLKNIFLQLIAMDIFFLATAKIATFTMDIVWESCLKLNLEQLSHSMSVENIASLAVAKEAVFPWIRV